MTKLFVFDTNTLVSAFILGSDKPARAFDKAISLGRIVMSPDTFSELSAVFVRSKFDPFISLEQRLNFLSYFEKQALLWTVPSPPISACRDPKDNMLLELAVAAEASCIITGDKDLQVLDPFDKIRIVSPSDFISLF
jgi:uncharacterized protein